MSKRNTNIVEKVSVRKINFVHYLNIDYFKIIIIIIDFKMYVVTFNLALTILFTYSNISFLPVINDSI